MEIKMKLTEIIKNFAIRASKFHKTNPLEYGLYSSKFRIKILTEIKKNATVTITSSLPYLQISIIDADINNVTRSEAKFVFTHEGYNGEKLIIRIWYLNDPYNYWSFNYWSYENVKEFVPVYPNRFNSEKDGKYKELKDAVSVIESIVGIKYNPKRNSWILEHGNNN